MIQMQTSNYGIMRRYVVQTTGDNEVRITTVKSGMGDTTVISMAVDREEFIKKTTAFLEKL